jgi:hypothetical protein
MPDKCRKQNMSSSFSRGSFMHKVTSHKRITGFTGVEALLSFLLQGRYYTADTRIKCKD